MLEPVFEPRDQHFMRAFANGGAESSERAASASPNQNSSILRPTVAFSSSAVGAWAEK